MTRSLHKHYFTSKRLLSKTFMSPEEWKAITTLHTRSRSSRICADLIGKTVSCGNGKLLKNYEVSSNMVGEKIGDFFFTRQLCRFMKRKKKKKKFKTK